MTCSRDVSGRGERDTTNDHQTAAIRQELRGRVSDPYALGRDTEGRTSMPDKSTPQELLGSSWVGDKIHRVAGKRTAQCGATLARGFCLDFVEVHGTLCKRCFTSEERHVKYLKEMGLR